VRHIRHAAKVFGRDVEELAVRGHHGVVDPDIDRSPLALDPCGGCLHGRLVRDVARDDHRLATHRVDLAPGGLESVHAASDERHAPALLAEAAGHGAADAGGGAAHHHDATAFHV